jgi:hypothetical protein
VSVTVSDEKITVVYQVKLAEDSLLVHRLIAADAKDNSDDFVRELVGYVGLLQWKHPGWTPSEYYFDSPVLKAPVVRLPAQNGMVDISIESEPYALYVPRFEILLDNPDLDHPFKNDDLTINSPAGRVFLDMPHGENVHAIMNQNSNVSVIDRNQLSHRYFRLTVDSTQQRSMLSSFWAFTQIMAPRVHFALLRLVAVVLPLILLFVFASQHRELIPLQAWVISRPLLCVLLVLAVADVAFWLTWDLPIGGYGAYGLAITALLVVWLPAIRGLWRARSTAVASANLRRWIWIGASGLLWCGAATSGALALIQTRDADWNWLPIPLAIWFAACILITTFLLAAIFVDAALPEFSGRAVALATFAFTTILITVTCCGYWLLAPETQRLNFPGRSTGVVMSALLLVGLFGVVHAWVRAVVAETGHKRSRPLELFVLVLLVLVTLPWLIWKAVNRQAESAGAWSVFDLLDGLGAVEYLLGTACVFFIIWELDKLPPNRDSLRLKRSTIIFYGIFNFYWFNDQWLYVPIEIVFGASLLIWFALPISKLDRWSGAGYQPQLPIDDKLGQQLDTDGLTWSSGLRGAAYGAVAGLPWALLTLSSLDEYSWNAAGPYPLLDLMGGNLLILGQWPMYGFFFGYTYPVLRGAMAISKALTFTIIAVGPLSLSKLLSWQHTELRDLGFSTLEILAFSLLLAGLLEVSQKGLHWREVPKQYARSSLVTWATSLTVAIAAAVASTVTTGVTGLVAGALSQQFHFPSGSIGGP